MGSFQYATESDYALLPCLDVLTPNSNASDPGNHEAWSCAFAPDESCFAWSYGSPVVYIASWHQYKQKIACAEDEKQIQGKGPRTHCEFVHCGHSVLGVAIGWAFRRPRTHWSKFNFAEDLMLAAGLSNGRVRVWALSSGVLLHELMDHRDQIRSVAFAPDGTGRLVSASLDKTLKIWEILDDGNMSKTLETDKMVTTCTWSPNAKWLASAAKGGKLLLWNMNEYIEQGKLIGHAHDVVSCEFSNDSSILATASWDTKVILWDIYTCREIATFGHLFPPPRPIFAGGYNKTWVRGVSLSRDGRHVASVADDGYLRIWDTEFTDDPVRIAIVEDGVCCKYSPSGKVVAVGNRTGCVALHVVPMKVESLQHLCRVAIRKVTPTPGLQQVGLPNKMANYLQYAQEPWKSLP